MDNTESLTIKNAEATRGNPSKLSYIVDNLTIAAAYNRIVCLESGKPVDYIFVKVNEPFEKLLGMRAAQILGKKFSEILPPRSDDKLSDRIGIYADVALTGKPAETERYIKYFEKWFHIHLYSPEKGYFLELLEDITERKNLETNLGLNIQNLNQLASSENGLWVLDERGVTTYVNTKMANILGYSVDELIGDRLTNFLDERSRIIAQDAGLPLKIVKNKSIELEFLHNAGTPVYTLVEASPVNDENGNLAGAILNVTDISERKRVEQALLKSQKKYSGLFQHMTDGFACCQMLFDPSGKPVDYVFSDVNEAFRRLTGLKDTPVLGKKISEILLGDKKDYFDWVQMYTKVSSTGKSLILEKYCPNLAKWFYIRAYCPEAGYIVAIIQDISERKKTDYALKQSERQYKKLANSITDLFFAVDSSLRFTYWNSAVEKFTNITVKDAAGRRVYQVFGRDKTTKRAVKVFLEVMRSRRAQTFTDKLPKGDQNTSFEMRVYPTGNGISVFARDVTERKRMQDALEQYTMHLEELVKTRTEKLKGVERLAAIGETAGMIGHDIRNPLQSIIGEVYLAKEELNALPEGSTKSSLTESVLSIEEQASYINKIVTDLQDYAKSLTPTFQEVDLEGAIHCVLSTLDTPCNIKVSYLVEKPLPPLMTDFSFIKRILTNLALNGIQAMQETGGELTINAFPRAKTAIIAVSDTGVGIPDAVAAKIFKPLFTTKSKGQGFGLAVVKKLVEALNGNISYETKIGNGTTFILEIPLTPS